MADDTLMKRVAEAYAWHRALGNQVSQTRFGQFVQDPAHPSVWSSNHVSRVTASRDGEIAALFAEAECRFGYCAHRLFEVDTFTPDRFVAQLVMEGYEELAPTLQMVLEGQLLATRRAELVLREALTDADWQTVRQLLRTDHLEGARTNRMTPDEAVTDGLVHGWRRKAGPSRMFIGYVDGQPCAYGAAVACPNGLGLIEDLYTLPEYRGRGIASTIIHDCVALLRSWNGSCQFFLGAHAGERPKNIYRKLGFTPLMVTREFLKLSADTESSS